MNWRRAAAWSLGIAALLVVGCALALRVLVDSERLIALAQEKARAQWNRELLIEGVSVRLWPVPSLHASKVVLANPEWAQEKSLLTVGYARADFELLPLLTGRMRIKNLVLEDVVAGLEETDDGRVSWALEAREPPPRPLPKEAATPDEGKVLHIAELRLRNVRINHRKREKQAAPFHVRDARIDAAPGLKDARIEAEVERHGQVLKVKARFADLSRLGEEGAASEGKVEAAWQKTRAVVTGTFALARGMRGQALEGELKGESIRDMLAFFGYERGETAPLQLRFNAREDGGRLRIEKLAASLGEARLTGDGTLSFAKGKPQVQLRLEAGRIDWLKTLVDAGGKVKPKRNDGQIFHEDPVAWRAISAVGHLEGTAELRIAALKLGNGVELKDIRTRAKLGGGTIELNPFETQALGGSASGLLRLDAPKKTLRVNLEGQNLMLEQWFQQRGSKVPFSGGPMRLKAGLTLSGETFREMAASVTGPVTIRMGKGLVHSRRAGEVEELMVSALVPRESGEIRLECVSASLDFRNGRAQGRRLVGARSNASQLLTSGTFDFREEKVDLRGALRAVDGPSLGLAALAGDVQITGKLTRPRMQLDEDKKPAILARAGAALATAGVTLLGGAIAEAADKVDPCEAVFK